MYGSLFPRSTLGGSSFFFQAEDGIRDADVTGVQTCALPISGRRGKHVHSRELGPAAAGGRRLPADVCGGRRADVVRAAIGMRNLFRARDPYGFKAHAELRRTGAKSR